MMKILVINGPNLNLLGTREPSVYGHTTLQEIEHSLKHHANQFKQPVELTFYQSHAEHELINAIHEASAENVNLIIINPAALGHTSIALRDALLAVAIPCIEVHLSNPLAREPFRRHSYIADIALGTITGFGATSYHCALMAAYDTLLSTTNQTSHLLWTQDALENS